jgi:hypothetical protein
MATEDLIYVYGICQPPQAPLTLPLGLQGETQLVMLDNIGAIVEPGIDLESIQAEEPLLLTAVLSHDRVIREVFQQQVTILPIRFGTQLASLAKVQEHLAAQATEYQTKLVHLAEKAEYQIKFAAEPLPLSPLPEGLKGRDYFLAKKQRIQDQTAQQQQQQADLETLLNHIYATFTDCVGTASEDGNPKVYLLLDAAAAERLPDLAEQWRSQVPGWQFSISEALPPYHFV